MKINGISIGTCVINDNLILFTTDNGTDRIYKVKPPNENGESDVVKLYSGNLNFNVNNNENEIINVRGKWKLDEDFGSGWIIQMAFEKPTNIKGNFKQNSFLNKNTLKLKGEKKPYKIYIIIGDPDSWEGLTLEQISTIKI